MILTERDLMSERVQEYGTHMTITSSWRWASTEKYKNGYIHTGCAVTPYSALSPAPWQRPFNQSEVRLLPEKEGGCACITMFGQSNAEAAIG